MVKQSFIPVMRFYSIEMWFSFRKPIHKIRLIFRTLPVQRAHNFSVFVGLCNCWRLLSNSMMGTIEQKRSSRAHQDREESQKRETKAFELPPCIPGFGNSLTRKLKNKVREEKENNSWLFNAEKIVDQKSLWIEEKIMSHEASIKPFSTLALLPTNLITKQLGNWDDINVFRRSKDNGRINRKAHSSANIEAFSLLPPRSQEHFFRHLKTAPKKIKEELSEWLHNFTPSLSRQRNSRAIRAQNEKRRGKGKKNVATHPSFPSFSVHGCFIPGEWSIWNVISSHVFVGQYRVSADSFSPYKHRL